MQGRRIVQRGEGDQLLKGGFHVRTDQGWRGEAFAAVHHPMGDQRNGMPEWFEGWCEPVLEHLGQVVLGFKLTVVLPGKPRWNPPGPP